MLKPFALLLLLAVRIVSGHGGHESTGPAEGETIQQYAQRHMAKEHHIDSFDIRSFFQLHDLNRNGYWSKDEIEAIYGVHHVYSTKKSKDDIEHKKKADHIVNTVLSILDANKDDNISPEELEKVGLDGLPNFDNMGAEGHHYDVESEFFLHHEEEFHSTPETQTDESYVHAEDLEHFSHHETIEREEAEKEAKFQGMTVNEIIRAQVAAAGVAAAAERAASASTTALVEGTENPIPAAQVPIAAHPHEELVDAEAKVQEPSSTAARPKVTRLTPPEKQDPATRFKDAKAEGAKGAEWGAGSAGYKAPTKPAEKMRKNLPYKTDRMQYKFRRNWGDF